jgi:YesN/AraC family two-component response regulator
MTKVLTISDEEQVCKILLKCLEEEGLDQISEENDFVGTKKIGEQLSDFVICEIRMPNLNGYAVLTNLHQGSLKAIIPLIFLTAKASKSKRCQGMDLKAGDNLTQALQLKELLRAIAVRLEKETVLTSWCAIQSQQSPAPENSEIEEGVTSQSLFPYSPQLQEVFNFIEANYHQPIGLRDVAQAVGYSAAYLTDLVRRQTGQPLHRWIIQRRMSAACSLLQETNQSVEQIAEAVGYRYVGCFFRQFRQSLGMTPQTWRNAQRTQSNTKHN